MHLHRRARLLATLGAVALLAVIAGCGRDSSAPVPSTSGRTSITGITGDTFPPGTPTAFYQVPDPLPPGKPGEIIASEPFPEAPAGSQAWRVMYHSTGLDGRDIAVTGVILAPSTGTPPPGGRQVVSWAHPTTGVADDCAPSVTPDIFYAITPGLQAMIQAGYVVTATDYEGLGTDQLVPYLVGISEGRSVLDAARAARSLPGTGAGTQVATSGWSQGGHASLFAGQIAPDYAPDLQVAGVAAAAPAGELAQLLGDDASSVDGVSLGLYAINAYQQVYGPTTPGLDPAQVLTPAAVAATPAVVALCNLVATQELEAEAVVNPLLGQTYQPGAATKAPWSDLLQRNTPGNAPIRAPVFVAQGTGDTLVIPSTTTELVNQMCKQGDTVQYQQYPGVTHPLIGLAAAADMVTWIGQRFAGQPAPSNCGQPPGSPGTTTGAG